MKRQHPGFTVIELIVAIIVLASAGLVFFTQMQSVNATHRDENRKVSINSIYYNLEEIVYPKLGGYPQTLDTTQLTAMDANLLKDPNGIKIGDNGSDFQYQPLNCNEAGVCKSYRLRSHMERETDYIKPSKNN